MTVFISNDPLFRGDACFYLNRYKDQNGNHVEVRKNKLPRGDAFQRLMQVQRQAIHKRLKDGVKKSGEMLAELKDAKKIN